MTPFFRKGKGKSAYVKKRIKLIEDHVNKIVDHLIEIDQANGDALAIHLSVLEVLVEVIPEDVADDRVIKGLNQILSGKTSKDDVNYVG